MTNGKENNGNERSSRLDRIERILEATAIQSQQSSHRLDRLEQIVNQQSINISEQFQQSNHRLDRLEQIVNQQSVTISEQFQQSNHRLDRLEHIVNQQSVTISEQFQQSNQRLDRFEDIVNKQGEKIAQQGENISQLHKAVQAALSLAQRNRENIKETEQLTRRNATAIARLEERMDQYIIEGREHREFIATQVEGIKVETRRILQHLFGENEIN